MCGIVGTLSVTSNSRPELGVLQRMLGLLSHRGPDAFGVYMDDQAALGSARLSIIDLAGGNQPIGNEDGSIWIVANGEVYNYPELRAQLQKHGHNFATRTDTEVVLHLFEEQGERCVEALNGQFAFAIWDARNASLLLARDRLGVRPLFYTFSNGNLIFASEIKAIFANSEVRREMDRSTLDQVFTYWAPLPGHTAFAGVHEVRPGHTLSVRDGRVCEQRYWALDFAPVGGQDNLAEEDLVVQFRELLIDATRIRLRADVPVGAYLSGGLDSSATAAIIRQFNSNRLLTFSIAFADPAFDESAYQEQMVRQLGVEHHTVSCTGADISAVFPDVVWHAEVPILRTAPAPMYLLSKLVRQTGFKVVLTGEGADEFVAGYNIFKEDRIRRFWAKRPGSRLRPLLLRRLYPYVANLHRAEQSYLEAFFGNGLTETGNKGYSHLVRWRNTARLKRFFSDDIRLALASYESDAELSALLEDRMLNWPPLSQAQFTEATIFLSQYLLSSQGDRMGMANSVEGRFPFLDPRLVEFCGRVPSSLKLRGLNEKYMLKRAVKDLVPAEIRRRPKQPYRAPTLGAFFGNRSPEYVGAMLSQEAIQRAGYFNPTAVDHLVDKARDSSTLGEMDIMALVGILSTQLLHHQFIETFESRVGVPATDLAILVRRSQESGYVCSPAEPGVEPAEVRRGGDGR